MKNIAYPLLFALSLTAQPAFAQSELSGTYIGCVTSGGQDVAMRTIFTSNKSGTFEYLEGSPVRGKIKKAAPTQKGALTYKWTDKYGSGTVTLKPNSNGSQFKGEWVSYNQPEEIGRWDGTKNNSPVNLENIKCTQKGFRYTE